MLLLLFGFALFVYASLIEPNQLRTVRYSLVYPNLPSALDGLTVVHLSDLHGARPRGLAARVNRLSPDFILLTGDTFERAADVGPVLALLQTMQAREGKYAVLGNNDHGRGLIHLHPGEKLSAAGFHVLNNRQAISSVRGVPVCFAGVDDYSLGLAVPRAALAGVPVGCFTVLLSHSPDIVTVPGVSADLVVAGHTHGGQVCLPGGAAVVSRTRLGRRYAAGVHRFPWGYLAVTRGVGTSGLRLRFCCPPEIAVYELKRG